MTRNVLTLVLVTISSLFMSCSHDVHQAGSKLSTTHRKVIPLKAGEYLIKIEKDERCTPREFSVSQNWQYPEPTEAVNPVIELFEAQKTDDNWIRSAVCVEGKSYGWTVVTLSSDGAITADWGPVSVASVEMIETKQVETTSNQINLESNAAYIVDIEVPTTCSNKTVTMNGYYEYGEAAGNPTGLDKKIFTSVTPVTDNLFHRAICKSPAVQTAHEFIQTSKRPMQITVGGDIVGVSKMTSRMITARKKIKIDETTGGENQMSDKDAARMMEILESWGVVDTEPMYGATNLTVTDVRCQKNMNEMDSPARCVYSAVNPNTRVIEAKTGIMGKSSEDLYQTLEAIGATIPAGINPSYRAVGARKIICSRFVVPNPDVTCGIELL